MIDRLLNPRRIKLKQQGQTREQSNIATQIVHLSCWSVENSGIRTTFRFVNDFFPEDVLGVWIQNLVGVALVAKLMVAWQVACLVFGWKCKHHKLHPNNSQDPVRSTARERRPMYQKTSWKWPRNFIDFRHDAPINFNLNPIGVADLTLLSVPQNSKRDKIHLTILLSKTSEPPLDGTSV